MIRDGERPEVSLVISTLGRSAALAAVLESVGRQDFDRFEVVIVDQNDDDRVATMLAQRQPAFPTHHLRTPAERGLSRGRNRGWRAATGRRIIFPDDDCWYSPGFLRTAVARMDESGCDILTGRATNEQGRSINGRYETASQRITRANVWTTQIEWVVMFRREALERLDGYDERIGVGAASPWQSGEGQDIMLRALEMDMFCLFDPAINGHHAELNVVSPDAAMRRKGRAYARGMGHVLRKHRFGPRATMPWLVRPLGGTLLYLAAANFRRSAYYLNVLIGRCEGVTGRVIDGPRSRT